MKKLSLFMMVILIGTLGFSQVTFQIQAPSMPATLQNTTYPLTWADPGGGDWSTPDLLIPANSVTAALAFVDDGDGPALDPNGNPVNQNACFGNSAASFVQPSLVGKIAVIYRGDCQFGHKARAAELAGAVGCIIINHTGAPVGMAGGDSGLVVTIPLIMISEQDGDLLKADINAGTVTQAFIGNKAGLFANDLAMARGEVMRARRYSNLAALSQNASEFSVPVGAIIRNIGSGTQTGATLTATIDNGTLIYNQTATVPTLANGDSAYVLLPTFSQATYPVGLYTMTYTLSTNPTTDEEPSDNVIDASFMINDSLYSYGRLDVSTHEPLSPAGFRAGTFSSAWEGCFVFDDPNGSRMAAVGMTFSASTSSTDVLTSRFLEVKVYEWIDVFTDINDAALDFQFLNELTSALYLYTSDAQDSNIYMPYTSPIGLADNQRYLFCVNSTDQEIFVGFDNDINYTTTERGDPSGAVGHLQPSVPISVDGGFQVDGFGANGLDNQVAASVLMIPNTVGIDEQLKGVILNTYPNPANDVINVPVGDRNGKSTINVFDVTGKLVLTKDVTFNANETLILNVSTLTNGAYIASMIFDDAKAQFSIIINK